MSDDAPVTGSLPDRGGRPRLVVLGGPAGMLTFELPARGQVVIGRAPECDVCVDDPSLSRRHARLEVASGGLRVIDLGSRHGTRVRGALIAADTPTELALDEAVALGQLTILVQARASAGRTVWGRGYFELRVAEACTRAQRHGSELALVRVRAAAGAAAALIAALREVDVIGSDRPGQWDVLAPGLDGDGVDALVRSVAAAVPGATIAVARAPRDGVTPSALAATLGGDAAPGPALRDARPRLAAIGPMAAVVALVDRIAVGDISVLITGETGVGKEVVAEHLHARSRRAARPLLRVNCGALPEPLLESELFGHEKGAFTGAVVAKPGLLEHADGGTVLLDEIGELSPAIQVKLLRVLEQRELLRVGGLKPRTIDVRFLAATHRDLEAAVAAGRFREDLYFRIAGVTVEVPPLRARTDELDGLIAHFVAGAARALDRPAPRLDDAARALLRGHPWPGNLRELRNVLERATLLCDDVIEARHLPSERMRAAPVGLDDVRARTDELERQAIADALAQTGGDQGRAAALLGVSRRTLTNKLNRHGFDRPRKR